MDLPPGVLSREHFEHKKKNTPQSRRDADQIKIKQPRRVGIYTSFGPSIPVYTCIYTDTRIYGLNTYDD